MECQCSYCSKPLEQKTGVKKICAQVGNPDIAIVETTNPHACTNCNEYYLETNEMVKAIIQIKEMSTKKQEITAGIYS